MCSTHIFQASLETFSKIFCPSGWPSKGDSSSPSISRWNFTQKTLCAPGRIAFSIWLKRSEEHTSELQSHSDLVCRLLLEKNKKTHNVNRCGRSRHLARKLSLRRKRSSPNVCEMADRKSGSAGMPRPMSYAVFCLKEKQCE